MTNQEHHKYIAVAFLVHGCMQVMMLILMGFFLLAFFVAIPQREMRDFPAFTIFGIVIVVVFLIQVAFSLPSFIAGYGLWKRKSWAKTAGIVGAVFAAMHFPIGTAICVYAFWFLLGEGGKEMYPSKKQSFQANNDGVNQIYERDPSVPPQPPNLWG